MVNVAKKIRELRVKQNLTQWELAKIIDSSDSYIAHIERGRNLPSLGASFKLEKALHCTKGEISMLVFAAVRERALWSLRANFNNKKVSTAS